MIYFENAKVIEPSELKEMIDEEEESKQADEEPKGSVPVDRLLFIEAKTGDGKMKIFPAFLQAYKRDVATPPNADGPLMFDFAIAQCVKGSMGLLELIFKEPDFGAKIRVWDKPPKKSVRDETPWVAVEAGEQ